jgi:hypothetical protein
LFGFIDRFFVLMPNQRLRFILMMMKCSSIALLCVRFITKTECATMIIAKTQCSTSRNGSVMTLALTDFDSATMIITET